MGGNFGRVGHSLVETLPSPKLFSAARAAYAVGL